MNITIKQNVKPNLPLCKMNCDNGLHDKLNKYELTQFMNCHSTNLFIGKPKSGKTSLLYSFFKSNKLMKKTFHNIFLFQPSASRSSMSDKLFDALPDDQKFEELTLDDLQSVMDRIKTEDPDHNHCIIFDDMTAYLKNKDTLKLLKELIFNRRHLHVSIYFLVQTWFSVEKSIRNLFSNIFVFRVSKNQLTDIFDEVIEQKEDLIPALSKVVFDKPFQYLFINTDSGRLFKGFDELLIE